MRIAALRLVVLNTVIALAAVVPATALTVYLASIGVFNGEPGDGDFIGELGALLTFGLPSLGLLAAGGIAYVVLVLLVGRLVRISRLGALVMAAFAAIPLGIAVWPNLFTPVGVALVGSYCLIIGLLVRVPGYGEP